MGYYTEIIFGARLKQNTPKNIIDTLRCVANGNIDDEKNLEAEDPVIAVDNDLIEKMHLYSVMKCSSYYFGVCDSVAKMWWDDISNQWVLSFRASCKNYSHILENFVEWIRPYVESGSGEGNIIAIITGEDELPILYGLNKKYCAKETEI